MQIQMQLLQRFLIKIRQMPRPIPMELQISALFFRQREMIEVILCGKVRRRQRVDPPKYHHSAPELVRVLAVARPWQTRSLSLKT